MFPLNWQCLAMDTFWTLSNVTPVQSWMFTAAFFWMCSIFSASVTLLAECPFLLSDPFSVTLRSSPRSYLLNAVSLGSVLHRAGNKVRQEGPGAQTREALTRRATQARGKRLYDLECERTEEPEIMTMCTSWELSATFPLLLAVLNISLKLFFALTN